MTPNWSIIVTAPQREKAVKAALDEARMTASLPLARRWRGRIVCREVTTPIMRGYVFAQMAPHEIHAFRSQGALRLIVPPPMERYLIADYLEGLEGMVAEGLFDEPMPLAAAPRLRRRNRKTARAERRDARMAKRAKALGFIEGLTVALQRLDQGEGSWPNAA